MTQAQQPHTEGNYRPKWYDYDWETKECVSIKDPNGSGIEISQDGHGAITIHYPDGRKLSTDSACDIDVAGDMREVVVCAASFWKVPWKPIPQKELHRLEYTAFWVPCNFWWIVGTIEERVYQEYSHQGMIHHHFLTVPIPACVREKLSPMFPVKDWPTEARAALTPERKENGTE